MSGMDETTLLAGFVIFCRIGMCLAFAPGFSSPRMPMRVRLMIALGLTVALAPGLLAAIGPRTLDFDRGRIVVLIVRESATGAALGIVARLVFSALETMFTAASMAIGLSSSFAPRVEEGDSIPELAAIVLFAVTAMLFVMDFHWEIVRAVLDSYSAMPLGSPVSSQFALSRVADTLSFAFSATFRLASPFLAFGLVSNFAFALVNKITPQIAIYFVSTPVILFGGLVILYSSWTDIATIFLATFRDWLVRM